MDAIQKIEEMPALPEPHVLDGHYRDHSDKVSGFSHFQVRTYAHQYALQTLASKEAELVRVRQELNEASVAEFAAQSANRHLSGLVDFERQVSERCMAVMKALMDSAEPLNNDHQDCFINYADYAKFVDAHAELLYVIKNGERPAIKQPTE